MKSFRQYTEEMNPPEQDTEDKTLKSKEKKQAQIKKMVLLKKMQAVRAGAGADIVASHEPEGEMVEGSLHKWFSGSKSKDGKPGWVQSDGSPCANEPGETKTPKCYSSSKRASMSKKELRSADARKSKKDPNQQQKSGAAKPTYVSTDKKKMKEENEVDECWKTHKKVGMKKKGGKMVPDCRPKTQVTTEAKVDKGRSDYGKASIRNYRRSGPDTLEPAMFDPDNKRGKTIDKRREEHKARRGVKGAKVPAYKREEVEVVDEATRLKKEKGYKKGGSDDKALNYVKSKLRKEYGKPEGQRKKEKGVKSTAGTGKYLERAKSRAAYKARAKKAGFKSTQDYTDTVARYGSEDNYKKGKGLGT